MPRQPHAAQHVDAKEALPIFVGNIKERLGLEDAEIVDQNVGFRHLLNQSCRAFCGAKIGCHASELRPLGISALMCCHRLLTRCSVRPLQHYMRPGFGQPFGDGKADSRGRSGNNRGLFPQLNDHACLPVDLKEMLTGRSRIQQGAFSILPGFAWKECDSATPSSMQRQ